MENENNVENIQTLNLNNVPDVELSKMKEVHLAIQDKMLEDENFSFVSHHLDTCNLFYSTGISKLFKEHNPIQTFHDYRDSIDDYKYKCRLYLGGKNGDKVYYGKPIIYENSSQRFMYPNDARLKNMSYSFTVHYDVEVEYEIYNKDLDEKKIVEGELIEKVFFGKFPIMLKSNLCILQNLTTEMCYSLGECKEDYGGYFIIDGKEKAIIPQEKFANNMIYSRKINDDASKYDYSIEIKSVSEDSSKPQRTLKILRETSTPSLEKNFFVVDIPNVRKPIPFFILLRALGFNSDKNIVESIVLDIEENDEYLEYLTTSVHDAGEMFSQLECIRYIGSLTKGKTEYHGHKILCDFLLPHLGEKNYKKKGYYLSYMLFDLLKIIHGEKEPTDRDHFKYKRVETSGDLMFQLCNEYLNLQYKNIFQKIDKEYYYHEGMYSDEKYLTLIDLKHSYFFEDKIVNDGFRKAFKGNWGAYSHTKRDGAVQDLNRLSYNSFLSLLRKINLPFDSSAKVTGPRLCHGSQYGIIDPIDTPDGGNVGLHKHLTIATKITTHIDPTNMLKWLDSKIVIYYLGHVSNNLLNKKTKLFINGNWIGVVDDPIVTREIVLSARRIGLIPYFVSICFIIGEKRIEIYTDGGRLIRPTFYTKKNIKREEQKTNFNLDTFISYEQSKSLINKIVSEKKSFTWFNCISGFLEKKIDIDPVNNLDFDSLFINNVDDLYNDAEIRILKKNEGIIDYLDASESESIYLCPKIENYDKTKNFTHIDIDPSFLLGIMGNQIVFPEHNPLPRDLFGCGQAKQAVSQYHSNFRHRIDKFAVNLNYGQQPILRSKYLKHIQNNKHPHGENPIVAIMCYTSYNVEDAILINEGSLNRGIFRTTYYNMYETHEETSKLKNSITESKITNVFNENIERTKPGYDYNYLDENGLIKENTKMNDKITVIGKVSYSTTNPNEKTDSSVYPKKGQLGYVDKAFISDDEEGRRLAKIRIREERIPAIGDKFCSRCGQKGTIGNIIPESDMPFTKEGIRPDIIINPHAIPSRMTIGQLIETIISKTSVFIGSFADGTSFLNQENKHLPYGEVLTRQFGYHSKGTEILYNGMNGEQLESEIFIGPTYYMRLKHMVKDKINYRSKGPRTLITRQTVQGRANDGGLRVGEMERDVIAAHGLSSFLRESMMERGDKYKIAVCNKTGALAIYNQHKNVYLSPQVDGPIQFNISNNNVQLIQKSYYGYDFSIVEVPYAFKLLMQELMACNVQMKIITEDNIDQMTNILYGGRYVDLKKIEERFKEKREKQEKQEKKSSFFDFGIGEEKLEDIPEEKQTTTGDLEDPEEIFISPSVQAEELKLNLQRDEDEDEQKYLPDYLTGDYLPWKFEKEAYFSLIIDDTESPSDIWAESEPPIPNIYPLDWNHNIVSQYKLDERRIVSLLKEQQVKNNWRKVIKQLIDEKQIASAVNSPPYQPNSPSPAYQPNSPQYQPNVVYQPNNQNSNSETFANYLTSIGQQTTNGLGQLQQQGTNVIGQAASGLGQLQQQGTNVIGEATSGLGQLQQQGTNVIGQATTGLGQLQQQAATGIGQSQQQISNAIGEVQQQGSNVMGQAYATSGNALKTTQNIVTDAVDGGLQQGQQLLSSARKQISNQMQDVTSSVGSNDESINEGKLEIIKLK